MNRIKRFVMPLSVVVSVAVVAPLVVRAQQPGYKGSAVCVMCHKNTHKDLVAAWQESGHASALWPAEAAGSAANYVIKGDFAADPGFQQGQTKWVLGSGIRLQAYVDADHNVLPKWWDVKAKAWEPAMRWDHQVKKMVEVGADTDARTACLGCHATAYDPKAAAGVENGVGCEACHGPGGGHVAKPSKDTIVRPQELPADRRAMICGQCHSQGADTSGQYAFPVGFKPSDNLTESFVIDNPVKGAMSQQYLEWRTSGHAKNDVPCVSCHDPHGTGGRPAMLKQEGNALCLSCHKTRMPDNAIHKGSAEKGTPVCTMCHMPRGSHMFKKPGT